MVKDGVYSVTYQSPLGIGTGIAFARNGLFQGGDAAFGFEGNFSVVGNSITADIEMFRHSNAPAPSVVGAQGARLHASGGSTPDGFILKAPLGAVGDLVITARFVRA